MEKNNWDEFTEPSGRFNRVQPRAQDRDRLLYPEIIMPSLKLEDSPTPLPWAEKTAETTSPTTSLELTTSRSSSLFSEASCSSTTSVNSGPKQNYFTSLGQKISAKTITLRRELRKNISSSSNPEPRNPKAAAPRDNQDTIPEDSSWFSSIFRPRESPSIPNLDLDVGLSTDVKIVKNIEDYVNDKLRAGHWSLTDEMEIRKWAREESIRRHDLQFSRTSAYHAMRWMNRRLNDQRRRLHAFDGTEKVKFDMLPIYSSWMRYGKLSALPVLQGEGSWAGPDSRRELRKRESPEKFWAEWEINFKMEEEKEAERKREQEMQEMREARWRRRNAELAGRFKRKLEEEEEVD